MTVAVADGTVVVKTVVVEVTVSVRVVTTTPVQTVEVLGSVNVSCVIYSRPSDQLLRCGRFGRNGGS